MAPTQTDSPRPSTDPAEATTGDSTPPAGLEDDEVFHLLQTRRRRLALHYLRDSDGPVEMADLAEQVAAWEHDTTVAGLSSKQRQRVYIPLYQTHLPKLDEAGLIEYDQHRGDIVPKERLHQVTPYLPPEDGVTDARELPAGEGADDPNGSTAYFGGMSVVGTGLVAAAWTGLVALPGIAVGTIVTVMFAVATFGIGRW